MEKRIQQVATKLIRVVLYGPESTGKTTLAKALAAYYTTNWVPEFARDYLQTIWDQEQRSCSLEDLPYIVAGQMRLENQKLAKAQKWLFCDTNALVTQVWSETHFDGYCTPEIIEAVAHYHYDFYLITKPDIPWEKDDLRDRPEDREKMYSAFEQQLLKRDLPFAFVEGFGEKRLQNAIKALENWQKNRE